MTNYSIEMRMIVDENIKIKNIMNATSSIVPFKLELECK